MIGRAANYRDNPIRSLSDPGQQFFVGLAADLIKKGTELPYVARLRVIIEIAGTIFPSWNLALHVETVIEGYDKILGKNRRRIIRRLSSL